MAFAFRKAVDFGIDGDRLVDVVFIGVVAGVICARAYYVAFAPFEYESIWQMLDIRQGGLAIYGGVIGAFVFGGLAAKWRKVPILPLFDLVGICFLIGQGHRPLGQLCQPGSLWHQHRSALGHDQRGHRQLPDRRPVHPGR